MAAKWETLQHRGVAHGERGISQCRWRNALWAGRSVIVRLGATAYRSEMNPAVLMVAEAG